MVTGVVINDTCIGWAYTEAMYMWHRFREGLENDASLQNYITLPPKT